MQSIINDNIVIVKPFREERYNVHHDRQTDCSRNRCRLNAVGGCCAITDRPVHVVSRGWQRGRKGPKIGAASWQFGVSATSENKEGANQFIEFMLQDKYLARFSDGIGLIPPTAGSAALSEKYRPAGPLEVFFELSEAQATLRALTPGYVVASKEFEKAMADIANGADVADALDAAADAIDADVERNGGYQ